MLRAKVSKKQQAEYNYTRWNTFINLLTNSDPSELSEIQRMAYHAFWYDSEINNGGHFQYFCNWPHINKEEVKRALIQIGAKMEAEIFLAAWTRFQEIVKILPEEPEEYIEQEQIANLLSHDLAVGECQPGILDLLERFLDEYESDFIDWTP